MMRRERPSVVLYSRTVLLEVGLSGYDTQRFRKTETTMEVRKKNQLQPRVVLLSFPFFGVVNYLPSLKPK